jgi:hypothetical protein
MRGGIHKNPLLQNAFKKYGQKAFSFEILLVCNRDKKTLSMYEQRVLDSYDVSTVYNIQRECVESRLGVVTPPETRAKQSASAKGRKPSPQAIEGVIRTHTGRKDSLETKEKRSASLLANVEHRRLSAERLTRLNQSPERRAAVSAQTKGKKRPPDVIRRSLETRRANAEARGYWINSEAIEKTAAKNRGRKHSPEHCAAIAAAGIGRISSLETRAKISASNKDKVRSPEQRAAISAALTGKKHSPERNAAQSIRMMGQSPSQETRNKISKSNTGKKRSPEACARIAAGIAAAKAKKIFLES